MKNSSIIVALLAISTSFYQCQSPKESTNELTKAAWKELFNGKDLSGWKHVGPGAMVVEDGMLHGEGGMGLLYLEGEKYGNCVFHIEWKMQKENSNSGVFIRIPIEPLEEMMPVFYGNEVQIDNKPELSGEDEYHYTGTLYSFSKPLAKPGKPGPEWNSMDIYLDGPRTVVMVNDVKVTDFKDGDPVPKRKFDFEPFHGARPDSGYFGLQNHGKEDIVYFRKVAVRPITQEDREIGNLKSRASK